MTPTEGSPPFTGQQRLGVTSAITMVMAAQTQLALTCPPPPTAPVWWAGRGWPWQSELSADRRQASPHPLPVRGCLAGSFRRNIPWEREHAPGGMRGAPCRCRARAARTPPSVGLTSRLSCLAKGTAAVVTAASSKCFLRVARAGCVFC